MRRGTFGGYYQIHIVEDLIAKNDEINLRITYSELEYPDFISYINDKCLTRAPISYKDENNEADYYVLSISLAKTNENLNIDFTQIHLRKEKYGDLVENISNEEKKGFVTTQYHGIIKMKKVLSKCI